MEALHIYPITKLSYKRQDHVLGIEIGREDFGVKLVFSRFLNTISTSFAICLPHCPPTVSSVVCLLHPWGKSLYETQK